MFEVLDGVLDKFRPGFDADGFDVSVQRVDAGVAVVQIVHRPNACEECLVPDELMRTMLTNAFHEVSPGVSGVRIEHVRPA